MPDTNTAETYAYLGPAGTFSEAALQQVPQAAGKTWLPVHNVAEALAAVTDGVATGAVIAIENSVDGGVAATQDALATVPGLRIQAEVIVPVSFVLVARPGTKLADVKTVNAHPVAYAQCQQFVLRELPGHGHIPSSSNVAAAANLLEAAHADAAIAPPNITEHYDLEVLAQDIGDNGNAVTRFVLVSRDRSIPERTGADKTSLIVELPTDSPGALVEMLEQFSTRGVSMSLLASRPIGDALGRYRFVIDLNGHIHDERVADALLGLRRFSPNVTFLGSYPRADQTRIDYHEKYDDAVFVEARAWLGDLLS
ncbi:MAG: prephenate dehydratase [Microbacteriaceae bacterium]